MAANVTERRFVELPPDKTRLTSDLDRRIAEMRRLLAATRPSSAASALRSLREAFPDTPLNERVRALDELWH